MKVYFRDHVEEFDRPLVVNDLILKLNLNAEEILILDKNTRKILPSDHKILIDDEIEIREVISGG